MQRVWLVTGTGHGLGRAIAEAALSAGDKLIATARDLRLLDDLVAEFGDAVRPVELDVADEGQGRAAVQAAVESFGRLDVLVNNAGYGDSAPFEEMSSEDFRRLIDVVFFGTAYLTRAALPIMRAQRSGLIVQISSAGGRHAWPGQAAYHAAKWAVGGFTDAVRAETAPFGVRLITLEPGGIRTDWGRRAYADRPPMHPDYHATVGASQDMLASYWGHEPIDPRRFAALVVRLSRMEDLPARLLIGAQTCELIGQAENERAKVAERWRPVSECVEFDSGIPVEAAEPLS